MSEATGSDDVARDGADEAMLSRLKIIEDQPLDTRAEQLAQVYEELRATLEAGDSPVGPSRPVGTSRPVGASRPGA